MGLVDLQKVSYLQGKSRILEDINLEIETNKLYTIIGRSGSGKTTLLKHLNLLISPTSGNINYDGQDIFEYEIPKLRSEIAYVQQEPLLFDGSVRDNLFLPFKFGANSQKKIDERDISEALARCQLTERYLDKDAETLSGGEKQRAALARALLLKPNLLLLDEPTSALDVGTEGKLIEVLLKLKADLTLVIVTHSYDIIKNSDVSIFLCEGKITKIAKEVSFDNLKTFLGAECNV